MSERILQVNELLAQEIGKIFLEDLEFEPGVMATVMAADASDNLETANIWISVFPENKSNDTLNYINKNIADIQRKLNRRLSMKFVPRITFKIDKSQEYVGEIDKAFEELDGQNPRE
uniref:Ribosome-binding factor A n=1 Tax=candidate division CPR3 bacterium TaxID=2268181 RepID=A0A7C4R4Y5_UNCC3